MARDLYERGYKPANSLITVLTSPKSLFLLMLKLLIRWLYGLGFTIYYGWEIFLRTPQLQSLSVSLVILAIFATYLCFESPRAPPPATFGHIQTLVEFLDKYGPHLY